MSASYPPLLFLLFSCAAAASGRLAGLYHVAGDYTPCDLIEIDLASGVNATLFSNVAACNGITTNFPSFSASGKAGTLLVAINSAPAVSSIDLATGAVRPLGALANNDSDILTGLAHFPNNGITIVATQFGLWNATDPKQNDLLLPLTNGCGECFVVAGAWPTLYIADEASSTLLIVDVAAGTVKRATGLNSPIGTVFSGKGLLQEKSYTLYETPAAGGTAKALLKIPGACAVRTKERLLLPSSPPNASVYPSP